MSSLVSSPSTYSRNGKGNSIVKTVKAIVSNNPYEYPNLSSHYIAEITIDSGKVQKPTWRGLWRHLGWSNDEPIEFLSLSVYSQFVVFCMTIASSQGGAIAVWNTHYRRWEHVSNGDYVCCAMIVPQINAIISLHYVSNYSTPGHHIVCVTKFDRKKYLYPEENAVVPVIHRHGDMKALEPMVHNAVLVGTSYYSALYKYGNYKHITTAYPGHCDGEGGPVGIFLLKDMKTYIAHDAANIYEFTQDAIIQSMNFKKMD